MNANDNAFPIPGDAFGNQQSGLTKRELIAAMCLQGMLSQKESSSGQGLEYYAVLCADALIAELSKDQSK